MSAEESRLPPTLTLEQAAGRTWDVLVVGAGPAGTLAARELARRRASVLLVDKAVFPRQKVCGCCMSAAALATLESVGLPGLPTHLGAKPLRELRLAAGSREASIALPHSVALSRESLDAELVRRAIGAGADFLPRTLARLEKGEAATQRLLLEQDAQAISVEARVVLVADGLSGRLLRHHERFKPWIASDSRVGVGTMIDARSSDYGVGTIFMACGRGGYVGLVRVEDGRLDVAAALEPTFLRRAGGAGAAAAAILHEAGFPTLPGLRSVAWRGTPALTRRRSHVAAERLFVIGDSAGYVEPFTGEGIAWALASGAAVAPFALAAVRRWRPALAVQWSQRYHQLLRRRQRLCRGLTMLLHHVALTRAVVGALSRAPFLAAPLVSYLNRPLQP